MSHRRTTPVSGDSEWSLDSLAASPASFPRASRRSSHGPREVVRGQFVPDSDRSGVPGVRSLISVPPYGHERSGAIGTPSGPYITVAYPSLGERLSFRHCTRATVCRSASARGASVSGSILGRGRPSICPPQTITAGPDQGRPSDDLPRSTDVTDAWLYVLTRRLAAARLTARTATNRRSEIYKHIGVMSPRARHRQSICTKQMPGGTFHTRQTILGSIEEPRGTFRRHG